MSPQSVYAANRISMECKLFVWSIVLEPLLFFVMSSGLYTGINITLARVLQILFLIVFICKFAKAKNGVLLPNLTSKYHLFFTAYFCLLIISSLFGVAFYGSYDLKNIQGNGHVFRSFLEFIILLYYFFYFVVLPQYILTSKPRVLYLIKCIERAFYFCLILGFLDLFVAYFWPGFIPGSGFIPRHLVDSPDWVGVGVRFHGIAGEPRDAFPYLIFVFLVIHIKTALLNQKPSRMLLPIVLLALLSTQSGSGVVGIALGAVIFALFNFNLTRFSAGKLKAMLAICLTLVIMVYYVSETDRLRKYYLAFLDINDLLSSGAELPILIVMQSSNVFPLWATLQNILNFNLLPVLFGSGLGTSAIVNSNLGDFGGAIANSHAQITRTLFESGFVGLWLYILFFYTPFKILLKHLPKVNRQFFYFVFFMLLGTSLGHRSTTIFVFTGIVISICHIWFQQAPLSTRNLRRDQATQNPGRHSSPDTPN